MPKILIILSLLSFNSAVIMGQIKNDDSHMPRLFPKLFLDTNLMITQTKGLNKVSLSYQIKKLPLFCRIEHKFEMRTRMPVRIRLGSVDYVDKLEGKK